MNAGKILVAGLGAGVVANALDFVSYMYLFKSAMTQPFMVTTQPSMVWLIVCDFVAALTAALVYDRVRGSFPTSATGGATFGLYAGILVNFPTWIIMHLLVKDWSYGYSWFSTIYGIVWMVIIGTVIGAVYNRGASAQPA